MKKIRIIGCLIIMLTCHFSVNAQRAIFKALKETPATEVAEKKTAIMKEVLHLSEDQIIETQKLNEEIAVKRKDIFENTSKFSIRGALKPIKEEETVKLEAILTAEQMKLYNDTGKEEINLKMKEWLKTK
ncbi:hypothetical protein [Aquimarina rhabdastrellae]